FLGDSHLVAEKCELLLFSFEVRYVLISENEIQGDEPHSDVLSRMDTPETDVLSADGFVEIAREKVKHAAMAEIRLRLRVFFLDHLLRKCHTALARLRPDEMQELLASEIAGMRGHKVEETRFFLGIAKAAQVV